MKENQDFLKDTFYDCVKSCQTFVFTPTDLEDDQRAIPEERGDVELAVPFRICSFEMLGENNYISVSNTTDQMEYKVNVRIGCIMNVVLDWDDGDKEHMQYIFCSQKYDDGMIQHQVMVSKTASMENLIEIYCDRINKEVEGSEKVKEKVRIGIGKDRVIHKIKRIIHIRPKGKSQQILGVVGEVNWSHRFLRRGHWRNFYINKEKTIFDKNKLGKNRAGDYCVAGKTWVIDSVIGDEDLPLIKKTRLVVK
jgi:hypothetical protein